MTSNRDRYYVIDIIVNMIIKIVVAISSIIAFWVILFHIIKGDLNNASAISLGILDSILGGTFFVMVIHYFPALKKSIEKN